MAGRGSVFSEARVIELARRFVPAADEVWRLQRGTDADCLFFQRSVNGGEPITDKGTRQGIWILAASGKLLAHVNSLRADDVIATMLRGLEAWEETDAAERRLDPEVALDPGFRWEGSYPEEGLVLDRFARDLPAELDPASRPTDRFNRDFVWFSAEEARAWLPAEPDGLSIGTVHRIPDPLAARLARFALVDNVRGQTLPFAPSEVRGAWLEVEVVGHAGETLELVLRGATEAIAEGPWLLGDNLWKPSQEIPRGIATTLAGRATFDLERGAFTAFEALAIGRRWGRSPLNGRGRDASQLSMGGIVGFHLALAPADLRIAPTFLSLYEADWVKEPEGWAEHPENRP